MCPYITLLGFAFCLVPSTLQTDGKHISRNVRTHTQYYMTSQQKATTACIHRSD